MKFIKIITQKEKQNYVRKAAIRFYFTVMSIILLFFLLLYLFDRKIELARSEREDIIEMNRVKTKISQFYLYVVKDLFILASNESLFSQSGGSNRQLAELFLRHARIQHLFQQIRFIDLKGREVVRVDNNDYKPAIVSAGKLQNKRHRYYFHETMALKNGEVFISRLDLNVENKEIEIPLNPVVRFAMPVTDNRGVRRGMLIINYSARHLMEQFETANSETISNLMLLNAEGDWLYHPKPEFAWGFQLPGRKKFGDLYPQIWKEVLETEEKQFVQNGSIVSYSRTGIESAEYEHWKENYARHSIVFEEKPWIVVSMTEKAAAIRQSNQRFRLLSAIWAIVMGGLIPMSIYWGKKNAQSYIDQKRINTYARIIEQSDEMVYVTDASGKILFANPALINRMGYSLEELIGKNPRLMQSGLYSEEFYQDMYKTIEKEQIYRGVFINRTKQGEIVYEMKTISTLKDDEGKVSYYVSAGWDISHEQRSREREQEITTRMSGAISHNFNNLLNIILNYVKMALRKIDEKNQPKLKQYLETVYETAAKAEQLVDKIFKSGHLKIENLTKVSLVPVIKEIVADYRKRTGHDIEWEVLIEEGLPNTRAKIDLLDYALRALIANSIDAIRLAIEKNPEKKSGKIEIKANKVYLANSKCVSCNSPISGDFLQISVADNGSGIDPAVQDRVFDPFFSNKDSSNSIVVNPGLGLTSVRSIVHAHNGHLLLNSKVGQGAEIITLLPLEIEKPLEVNQAEGATSS